MQLLDASDEQKEVLAAVHQLGQNVMVNSVAGSGKTTSSLHIAKFNPTKSVLLLTYNKKLKEETRCKAIAYLLRNLEVHNYHAMGIRYYALSCYNDTELRKVVESNTSPRTQLPSYDIIIIDEAQDMTKIYHAFIHKIIRDVYSLHGKIPKLVVVGDENQCIFKFMKADSR